MSREWEPNYPDLRPGMDPEQERPQNYDESVNGKVTWNRLGIRVQSTDPVVPCRDEHCMEQTLRLTLCVDVKTSLGIHVRDISAYCWTHIRFQDNPYGIWKEVRLKNLPQQTKRDSRAGISRYVFQAFVKPTRAEICRLTYNVKWRNKLVWANHHGEDCILTLTAGRIRDREDFDAAAVVEQMRNALGGAGTDEAVVIDILGNHSLQQRLEIVRSYKVAYGKDLVKDIKNELSGDFEEICLALMTSPRELDAQQLNEAISGAGTDETTLIEVLATKNNAEIEEIKAAYQKAYNEDLEQAISSDTSGYFRRMMVSLLVGGRQEEGGVDVDKAKEDAQKFYDAGADRWGTEEAALNAILCLRSREQLQEIFQQYEEIAGTSIEEAIDSECSGDLKEGYLAIVRSTRGLPGFFAERIRTCVDGIGTTDSHLIRIIVSRSEIDLDDIDAEYQSKYGNTLEEVVESECSGDYKKILIAVIKMQE